MNNILSQKVDRKVVQKILALFTMAILASSGSVILLPATVPAAFAAVTPTVSQTVLGETNIIQVDIDDAIVFADGERAVGSAEIESDPDHAAPLRGDRLRVVMWISECLNG